MDIISVSITLFLIMDPFGNIPLFLLILKKVPVSRRRSVLVRELLLALFVILIFVFCGRHIMNLIGLKQESISIAGSIILFLIGVHMVFPVREVHFDWEYEEEPLLVPLAVPLIAGPSLLAVLLVFSTAGSDKLINLLLASLLAWSATFIVLFSAACISNILTRRGLIAMERLMGMVLVALSVQFFLDGIASYLALNQGS
jgi:multiple antibiotic resistance protein